MIVSVYFLVTGFDRGGVYCVFMWEYMFEGLIPRFVFEFGCKGWFFLSGYFLVWCLHLLWLFLAAEVW